MHLEEQVRSEPSAERVLEALFGLSSSERKAYEKTMALEKPVTAADIAAELGCAQTSAYRYIDALEESGLFRRATTDFEGTGCSAWVGTPPPVVAERMERTVEVIFGTCNREIEHCRASLETPSSTSIRD